MKRLVFLVSLVSILSVRMAFADIVSPNMHFVSVCVEVSNLSDYPGIVLIAYLGGTASGIPLCETVKQGECLTLASRYSLGGTCFHAVKREFLTAKNVGDIDWSKETNGVGSETEVNSSGYFVSNTSNTSAIHQYYKILGFNSKGVVLFMWKEETSFTDGTALQTKNYTFSGDLSAFSQNITELPADTKNAALRLFPNPAQKDMTVQFANNYRGKVEIKMVAVDGNVVRNVSTDKTSDSFERRLSVEQLPKGYYLVSVKQGDVVETCRILVE